ncbi:helix-turn-helix domain-containing protein [Sphaerisporangium dianthi]|uniref:Scr1 family TA system antitoxin-like transcriptional regulator n=1 Tax=Sphaerisporangium dianthi TaxID=1436120 RepID=A0ABV9CFK3_9ACTN
MPTPREIDPSESPRALFAFELRRHRQAAGLTQKGLGARIRFSDSQVAMVESMRRTATESFARECDRALGLDGTMTSLYMATTWNTAPEYFRPWLEEEADATGLRSWEPNLIPGLLQTEAYAREMFATSPAITQEEIEERLAGRMRRQSILHRDRPPLISVVLDEAVLHRSIGGAEVMEAQLQFVLEVADRPAVTLQVVPYQAQAHCGLIGGFIIAERHGTPYAAYADAQPVGRTLEGREVIAQLAARYDAIRAAALPFKQSVKLIKEVVNHRDW